MQSTENSLTKVENGVSTLAAYKAFRTDAMVWADLKVNLVFRNNRAFIHVAGSESEYTDLGAARAYVHRVEDTIVGSVIEMPEMAVA